VKITRKWLEEKRACSVGKEWFVSEGITDPVKGIRNLVAKDHWDWANWLIVRVMNRKQYLAYAIFAAEQVIDIFEKKYPDDKRPRKAIDAAKAVLANDTPDTRSAADAAYASYVASYAASYAAAAAAYAAYAAYAADAAYAAYAAEDAAADAAYATAADERRTMKIKILEYGIKLLEDRK